MGIKGKFLPDSPTEEYRSVSSGETHTPKNPTKYCGPTKGNKDLPTNRTEYPMYDGSGSRKHSAGGKNAGKKKPDSGY